MSVKVAVVGCAHGELDAIYTRINTLPDDMRPELLIICGDFQALRSKADFTSISMPEKYKRLGDFHRYYEGTEVTPVLTIFIGGNHECGDLLAQLPHGGWVAPKIWYMGTNGVVWYKGLRIGGVSGIFKAFDFYKKRYETAPLDGRSVRSFYHTRFEDIFKMFLLRDLNMNCFITHDWPEGIAHYGDLDRLLRRKPFLKGDIEKGELGNPYYMVLLKRLMPNWWFSAHLHVKFEALVKHETKRKLSSDAREVKRVHTSNGNGIDLEATNQDEIDLDLGDEQPKNEDEIDLELDQQPQNQDEIDLGLDDQLNDKEVVSEVADEDLETTTSEDKLYAKGFSQTNFLALSKPLPNHPFFQIVDVPVTNNHISSESDKLYYDNEFLQITHWFERFKKTQGYRSMQMDQLSKPSVLEQLCKEINNAGFKLKDDLTVWDNFEPTLANPAEQTTQFIKRFM